MDRRPLLALLLLAACSKSNKQPPAAQGSAASPAAVVGGSGSATASDAEFQKALDQAGAAFEKYVEHFALVAKSFDGNCDAFVAQVKTLEPKLRDFTQPLAPYATDTRRMVAVDLALKPRYEAMQARVNDPALTENFSKGVKACESHSELQGALARGMLRKKK